MNPEPLRELEAVAAEMRERRVNHGKFTSPTLEAWANRISRALAQLDDGWQKDAGRLDWLDDINSRGRAPAIVNDDGGRYAFSDSGMSPVPEEGGHKEPVSITAFVEPHMWRGTIREAIDAAMAEDDAALPIPSPPAQDQQP